MSPKWSITFWRSCFVWIYCMPMPTSVLKDIGWYRCQRARNCSLCNSVSNAEYWPFGASPFQELEGWILITFTVEVTILGYHSHQKCLVNGCSSRHFDPSPHQKSSTSADQFWDTPKRDLLNPCFAKGPSTQRHSRGEISGLPLRSIKGDLLGKIIGKIWDMPYKIRKKV